MASGGKKVITPSSLVNCHLQVIGTGNCEVSPSFCLFTDSRRYIFNCGENLNRMTQEHRMKILKESKLFVTRVSWRNLGGLPGFAMSYRDGGRTHLHVHGPRRIAQFAEITRYFVGREKLKLVTSWESDPIDSATSSPDVYSDENVTITAVELKPESLSRTVAKEREDAASSLDDSDDIIGETVAPKQKRVKVDPEALPTPSTAAFICKLVDTVGKFNVERAKELGLKPGRIYKDLIGGESVTAPDGRVIHPSDVMAAKQIGPTFIVVECPDTDHISSVASHPKLQKDYFLKLGQEVALIVHLSPIEVLEDDQYCHWAASFGASTRHLILNEAVCPREVGLRSVMRIQYPLNLMNPNVHHPPTNDEDSSRKKVDLKLSQLLPDPEKAIIVGRALLKFHLKPARKKGEDFANLLGPIDEDIAKHVDEIHSNLRLTSAIATGQALTKQSDSNSSGMNPVSGVSMEPGEENPNLVITDYDSEASSSTTCITESDSTKTYENLSLEPHPITTTFQGPDDAVITFLGTGAAHPSRYRNVSGIMVQTPNSGNLLLDCGEGTLSQIYRCYPREIADEVVLNVKLIFISHVHGDHHLGLISVLQKKEQLLKQLHKGESPASPKTCSGNTVVLAPKYNIQWMHNYSKLIENLPCRMVDCSSRKGKEVQGTGESILQDFRFETVPVIHCNPAYGVVARHASGWSIVYSGDTRPCPALIEAGHRATLLIHEATLEDGLSDLAVTKKHCTVSEALEVSDKMNPDFTVLTHFSQRYPKIPSFLMTDQLHSRVGVAFDCMSVNLKQLDQLHKYLPLMKDIFAEVVDDIDGEEFGPTAVAASSW